MIITRTISIKGDCISIWQPLASNITEQLFLFSILENSVPSKSKTIQVLPSQFSPLNRFLLFFNSYLLYINSQKRTLHFSIKQCFFLFYPLVKVQILQSIINTCPFNSCIFNYCYLERSCSYSLSSYLHYNDSINMQNAKHFKKQMTSH